MKPVCIFIFFHCIAGFSLCIISHLHTMLVPWLCFWYGFSFLAQLYEYSKELLYSLVMGIRVGGDICVLKGLHENIDRNCYSWQIFCHFIKGRQICNFLFILFHTPSPLEYGFALKGKNLLFRRKCFLVRIDPPLIGEAKYFRQLPSLQVLPFLTWQEYLSLASPISEYVDPPVHMFSLIVPISVPSVESHSSIQA